MSPNPQFREGMLVNHPKFGLGKVVKITSNRIFVFFKEKGERPSTKLALQFVPLDITENQSDPFMDHLPPFSLEGEVPTLPGNGPILSLQALIKKFMDQYPDAFCDPKYLNAIREERKYKWEAHLKWENEFGNGRGRKLLEEGESDILRRRLNFIVSGINLPHPMEWTKFHDGLRKEKDPTRFFRTLFDFVEAPVPTQELFDRYAESVPFFDSNRGQFTQATWPVVTIFPFIANPKIHMFLKPTEMKLAAETLAFNFAYRTELHWETYESLLKICSFYKEQVKHLKPPDRELDHIDIQSLLFIARY